MSKEKRSIGFYGGTFDPIHFGHIQLALALKEKANLEKIYFCPTSLSPFKVGQQSMASAEDRLKMLQLALQGIEGFEILEEEIHQTHISYTIDTIQKLHKTLFEGKRIRLILGQDMMASFGQWKRSEELLQLAPPLCGLRSCPNLENPLNLEIMEVPLFDISSTEIRERIRQGKYSKHLLPEPVYNFIVQKKLYRSF